MIFLSIWPTTVEGWIGLIVLVIGLVGTLIKLIPTLVKLHKATVEAIRTKNIAKLKKVGEATMQSVQASLASGAEKKQLAMDAMAAAAKEMGVEVDREGWGELSIHIDEMKDFFNKMKESDKIQKGE